MLLNEQVLSFRLVRKGLIVDQRLLTIRAFADAASIGVPTLRRWIAQRRIASVRLGTRAVRVPASELERIVEEGTVPAKEHGDA